MRSLTITLPDELAEAGDARVAAGGYASDAALALDGIAALLETDDDFEAWMRGEVVASCREMAADPSRGVPLDDVLPRLKARAEARARRKG